MLSRDTMGESVHAARNL